MTNSSFTLLDRLICFFATLGRLTGGRSEGEQQLSDLLGQLKQLLLELSKEPAALPGARGQNLATPEDPFEEEEEPIFTRLGGRGIGQVWVWLCPDRVMRPGPRAEVMPRARGQPPPAYPMQPPNPG